MTSRIYKSKMKVHTHTSAHTHKHTIRNIVFKFKNLEENMRILEPQEEINVNP